MQCNDGTNASQVKFAKQLELCSEFPQEREVLMPLNSHFRVRERIAQDEHARKVHVVPLLNSYNTSGVELFVLEQI